MGAEGAAAAGGRGAGLAGRGSSEKSSSGSRAKAGTRRIAKSASPFFSVTRAGRMGRSRWSGGGAPTDIAAAAIDGRCASGVAGGVFFCFSSATRCRCLVITRRRLRSFSRRSWRRSRARVQFCQSWRTRSRQAASTLPSVDCTARAVPRATAEPSTTRVPAKLRRPWRKSASSTPKAPPAATDPSVQSSRPQPIWRRAGVEASSRTAPNPRPTTRAASRRRSRRQPETSRNRGIRKQVRPKKPNATAETWAPTDPAQLWAWVAAGTLCSRLGSCGWWLPRLRLRNSAAASMRIPSSSFPFSGERVGRSGLVLFLRTTATDMARNWMSKSRATRHEV